MFYKQLIVPKTSSFFLHDGMTILLSILRTEKTLAWKMFWWCCLGVKPQNLLTSDPRMYMLTALTLVSGITCLPFLMIRG